MKPVAAKSKTRAGATAPTDVVRAISIRQPYVEQILRRTKKIEYRSVPTNIRGTVYLYASLRPADDDEAWSKVKCAPGSLPTGLIVGTVDIVDCVKVDEGDFEYALAKPKRLARARRPVNQPQPVFWRPRFR